MRACHGYGCGTVFELTPSGNTWVSSIVHSFQAGGDGVDPMASLILDGAGNLYGTTYATGNEPDFNGGGTVFKLTPSSGGWTESVHIFREMDGAVPGGSLVADGQGNLYGTTGGGGLGFGTVFELSPLEGGRWQRTILYEFHGGADGSDPSAGLVFDKSGTLYGVTFLGGGNPPDLDIGVVFELSPGSDGTWKEKVIHVFQGPDGMYPSAWLVFDPAGNLYGTTYEGGSGGGGVVFELTPSSGGNWTETVLHNFSGSPDGCAPFSGVTLDAAGNVYGTTYACGGNGGISYGIAFELSPNSGGGWTETILYTFTGGTDGGWPYGGVILDGSGNLYGTAYTGGNGGCAYSRACGVVFELSRNAGWTESVIYDFPSSINANPYGALIFDSAGNLYGTASDGSPGNYCCGTVFKLTPGRKGKWKETTLHSFTGGAKDGATPISALVMDLAGNLYGTTPAGGPANEGVLFEITP